MRNKKQALLAFTSVFALAVGAHAANNNAELLNDTSGQEDDNLSITDVDVTAQRRTENAQSVPEAIHTLAGSDLQQDDQIKNVNDVAATIPNAQAGDGGSGQPRWFVRGLGTNRTDFNTVNPIGIYFDDIYIANTYAQEAPLYDLKRVEADLGPQGTLWGKNANAGAINYISNTPTFTPDGYARLGYGSFNHQQEEGAYGGSVIDDKVAVRVAFYNDDSDGWQTNLTTNTPQGGVRTTAGRIELLYTPSSDFDVLFNFHAYNREGTEGGWNIVADPHLPVSSVTYKTFYPGGYPVTDYGDINYVEPTPQRTNSLGGNAKVTDKVGDLTLTSITGAELLDQYSGAGGQVPYPATSPVVGETPSDSWSQNNEYEFSEELRLANDGSARWTWQTGLFGYIEHIDQTAVAYTPANLLNTKATQALGTTSANTYTEWSDTLLNQDKKSFSVFGSSTYNITDAFKIQGGLRWSDEAVNYGTLYDALGNTAPNNLRILNAGWINNPGAAELYDGSADHSFQAWVYDVKPQYKLTENVLAYVSYAHGVEPGGYTTATNTGLATAAYGPVGTPFSYSAPSLLLPEVIDAYEIGAKSQWFNNRLFTNVALFDNQINNAVTNVTTPVVNLAVPGGIANGVVFRNAGSAYARGGEVEIEAVPVENWHIGGNLGFLRTRYTSQDNPTYDLLGTQFPRSPKVNAQGSTSYDETLPWGGVIRWAADANWRSGFWFYPNTCYQFGTGCSAGNSGPDDALHENGYVVANAHVTWYPNDNRKLALQFDVLNASNTRYHTHALAGSTTGTVTYFDAQPISAFFSLSYKL